MPHAPMRERRLCPLQQAAPTSCDSHALRCRRHRRRARGLRVPGGRVLPAGRRAPRVLRRRQGGGEGEQADLDHDAGNGIRPAGARTRPLHARPPAPPPSVRPSQRPTRAPRSCRTTTTTSPSAVRKRSSSRRRTSARCCTARASRTRRTRARPAHSARPHRAPSPRCAAESMPRAWRRYELFMGKSDFKVLCKADLTASQARNFGLRIRQASKQ